MGIPPARPAARKVTGVMAPLARNNRVEGGHRHAFVTGRLFSTPLFGRMIAIMLVPAIVVCVLVLLLHLLGVL
jgi:hypothetical protein